MRLGGGYIDSTFDPDPTVAAVLEAAVPGAADALLVVLAGPPAAGKSAVAHKLLELVPNSVTIEKDAAAAGFIVEASRVACRSEESAYGSEEYWARLRPLEYGGATAQACQNLVGRRVVLLVGGWGPELAVEELWPQLATNVAPASMLVVHLNAPDLEIWRQRLASRGSRSDSPWFENFARKTTASVVWSGARAIDTNRPLSQVVEAVIEAIADLHGRSNS